MTEKEARRNRRKRYRQKEKYARDNRKGDRIKKLRQDKKGHRDRRRDKKTRKEQRQEKNGNRDRIKIYGDRKIMDIETGEKGT